MINNVRQHKIEKDAQKYLPLFKKHRHEQRDNYTCNGEKLYKNNKTSAVASSAIIRIFKGELVNINIENLEYFKFDIH